MATALLQWAESGEGARVLQDCDIASNRGAHVRSDIVLVRKDRSGIIGKTKLYGAPDLAIEIACACRASAALRSKKRIYSGLEIRELWILYPDSETVDVLTWTEIGYLAIGRYTKSDRMSSPLLHRDRIRLREIFLKDE